MLLHAVNKRYDITHAQDAYLDKLWKDIQNLPETLYSERIEKEKVSGFQDTLTDKIPYVGRDMEDALRAGFINSDYLSGNVKRRLGNTNSEVINTLVGDIIHNSLDKDEIRMSDAAFEAMNEFLNKNVEQIYLSKKIGTYEKTVATTVEALFEAFMDASEDLEKATYSSSNVIREFANFALNHPQSDCHSAIKVADYISGMTDSFCTSCFESLFRI